jgi:hypothetical protein
MASQCFFTPFVTIPVAPSSTGIIIHVMFHIYSPNVFSLRYMKHHIIYFISSWLRRIRLFHFFPSSC